MKIIYEGPAAAVWLAERELKPHEIELRYVGPEDSRCIKPIEIVRILLEIDAHLDPEELNYIVNTVRAKLSAQLSRIKFWVELLTRLWLSPDLENHRASKFWDSSIRSL